jgi:rod shape-determining protein MreC
VIGAPLSPQFRVVRIRIDRGDREVAAGMPVITSQGPVGRVDKAYGDYADVVLISDPSSRIDVVIRDPAQPAGPPSGERGERGLLVGLGRADSYACKIEWLERRGREVPDDQRERAAPERQGRAVPPQSRVKVGDEVVTSGLGASFPAGLVVGKVTRVGGDDGMFQSVEVKPTVDVSRVRAVMVLLAPPPPPDPDARTRRRSEPAFGSRPL